MSEINSKQKIFSVTELTRSIRTILESAYPSVWVEGEISNFSPHRSGHMYFTLKDAASALQVVIFSSFAQRIKFEVKDGLQVICMGRISVFDKRGQYQLYAERIEPKGKGALQLAFEQLKEKLRCEGLFDKARKRPIPLYPKKIGVVTSPTGAAIRDILNIVNRRFVGTHILLCPVRVQGEGSAEEIARGIETMNRFSDIDVLIVGRGGGSLEDLWAFNEEIVARAIVASRIPVISAVGHEVDWTIADMAADLRAPTPSAAAELVVTRRDELEERVRLFRKRLKEAMTEFLTERRDALVTLKESYAFRQPKSLVEQAAQRLDDLLKNMTRFIKAALDKKSACFREIVGKLGVLSPLAILSRGYSLTFDAERSIIKEAGGVKRGDRIVTYLKRGALESVVDSVRCDDSLS
ncbi:MAG: exodeoxyribonuclease VII large subunit [Candidatus Omnitrophica bacterium]|nr:exodeoxyribonuclease VII large subunit [Candidatus Omnitrophota bacterium]